MNARDPGLQSERTQLAWVRTGVAIVVNAALLLRVGALSHSTALLICAALLGAISTVVIALGFQRGRRLASAGPSPPGAMLMASVSAAGAFASGCALWAFSA
ncbi:DUF202 domain-containing protein [Piscinibacter sp.]|uniref:DUF202 domain-containing protein n=1 Tax=Piscinibacter sp. TaxID=1903157 RepID=UPI002D037868|nr:DUF202 domain-containing protein [Albitalea sp.]HUG26290.1 DUF202 domain-containing protein [Albitalea sp.]